VANAPVGDRHVKKRVPQAPKEGAAGVKHSAALESQIFGKLLPLLAHCAVNRYDDGDPRRTGWFTVKTMGSIWVVTLKEPDTALSLSCTGQTFDDALVLADLMLQSDDAPWEPDVFLKGAQANGKRRA